MTQILPTSAELFAYAKSAAYGTLDDIHARFLRDHTGNATAEEQATWATKELAARAVLADTADTSQLDMIGTEAAYLAVPPAALAATVVAKADQFKKLTGVAAGIRGKARKAIDAAKTDTALGKALTQARADVVTALEALQSV